MRIAIFSDIHANLPALQAVYNHALLQDIDAVYCLGDLVDQNVWNNEVIAFVRKHQIPCVRGNHDEGIGNDDHYFNFAFGTEDELKWGKEAIEFTLRNTSPENKQWLKKLPLKFIIKVNTDYGILKMTLSHGTPESNTERIYSFALAVNELFDILNEDASDILVTGNTHVSFHKRLTEQQNDSDIYKHIINPGSVGCPKDGSWHACYAIICIDPRKDFHSDPSAVEVLFFRLDYDIDTVIRAIQKSGLPLYYGGRLLKY